MIPLPWAEGSLRLAVEVDYALPSTPESEGRSVPAYGLDDAYEVRAEATAREQMAKAGFRFAAILNAALP